MANCLCSREKGDTCLHTIINSKHTPTSKKRPVSTPVASRVPQLPFLPARAPKLPVLLPAVVHSSTPRCQPCHTVSISVASRLSQFSNLLPKVLHSLDSCCHPFPLLLPVLSYSSHFRYQPCSSFYFCCRQCPTVSTPVANQQQSPILLPALDQIFNSCNKPCSTRSRTIASRTPQCHSFCSVFHSFNYYYCRAVFHSFQCCCQPASRVSEAFCERYFIADCSHKSC
jgi:hypothetical protein